jgi:hypothetical protein
VAAAIVEMSAHYFVTRLQARPQILAALEAARQPLCCHCGRHPQTSVTPVADLVPGIH